MSPYDLTIRPTGHYLDEDAIGLIGDTLVEFPTARRIEIDLSAVDQTDTAGFAALVIIRRGLLRSGRDMLITGLHDRVFALYCMSHLQRALPNEPARAFSRSKTDHPQPKFPHRDASVILRT